MERIRKPDGLNMGPGMTIGKRGESWMLKNSDLAKQYGEMHSGAWVESLPPSWTPCIQLCGLSPPGELFLIVFPPVSEILVSLVRCTYQYLCIEAYELSCAKQKLAWR